jgi:hypothetical protein
MRYFHQTRIFGRLSNTLQRVKSHWAGRGSLDDVPPPACFAGGMQLSWANAARDRCNEADYCALASSKATSPPSRDSPSSPVG